LSLEWLLAPVAKPQFFDAYWEQRELVVIRNQPDYFSRLLSLGEVDRVLTTLDRRYPDITLKNARRALTSADYTVDGEKLDIAKVYQLFEEGSTITLAYLDTVVPELARFCRSLESEFSFPFQANVYLTPANAQGAKYHYDTHDVFVLQVAGSKKWAIYGTPVESPLPGQEFDASLHERGALKSEFELRAGDVAYLPRGVVHEAHSTDEVSLHITAGILRYTWLDLLLDFVAGAALNDPAFRKALPPGFARSDFDRTQARETLRNLLDRVWAKADFDATLDHFVDEFVSWCPPLLEGQMAQLATLGQLRPESVVGLRPGVIFRLRNGRETLSLDCYGRTLSFPAYTGEAVRYALSHPKFAVRDLPGNLDEASKLLLVRRLIREGLVVALDTSN
jgi:ribosomal protein L16 Arg81 hydroxylase